MRHSGWAADCPPIKPAIASASSRRLTKPFNVTALPLPACGPIADSLGRNAIAPRSQIGCPADQAGNRIRFLAAADKTLQRDGAAAPGLRPHRRLAGSKRDCAAI